MCGQLPRWTPCNRAQPAADGRDAASSRHTGCTRRRLRRDCSSANVTPSQPVQFWLRPISAAMRSWLAREAPVTYVDTRRAH